MIKKIRPFLRHYPEFSAACLFAAVGAVLDISGFHTAAHGILGIGALALCVPVIKGMIETVQDGSYGLDILALTAIIVSVLLHQYWAGIVIVLMLTGGESLEDYASSRAQNELSALEERAPKVAHKLKSQDDAHPKEVTVKQIVVGDLLLIKPGELVPVDGEIVDGHSSVDESSITGESIPQEHAKSETVLSGAIIIDGRIVIRALRTSGESQYEQIVRLVKDAASSKSPFVRLADRYSIPFTVISFAIAIIAWIVSGHVIRFLDVLVVATPCPLLLGAPIALISGMSRAAKFGIVMKNGAALERLASVKSFAFDKTGTLTVGKPKVYKVVPIGKRKQDEVLRLAASVERESRHILAQVIVEVAKEKKLSLEKVSDIHESAGEGLRGKLKKDTIRVGKLSYMQNNGIEVPATFTKEKVEHTATYVAINNNIIGAVLFEDVIRDESLITLGRLRKRGIDTFMMLTGDNEATAQKIAKQLNITIVKANCLPQDKLTAIQDVDKTMRPIAMVGDGVNDAPVLAASDVGIALGARGSTAASESADVVIMLDDLTKVAESVEIARRTIFIGRQSILIGIGISIVLMFIFATGIFRPVVGAAVQEVVDVVVMINALRAHGSVRETLFSKAKTILAARSETI
jgi:heavy metal translocating P-type ATPase